MSDGYNFYKNSGVGMRVTILDEISRALLPQADTTTTVENFESLSGIDVSQDNALALTLMGDGFSVKEELALCVIQRIAGAVSVIGGVYIFWRAWYRRHCAFDRIMLGLSIHTVLWGIYNLWGTAAVPRDNTGIYGAAGNERTCTIQGFLFQITLCIPFYYVFLSCYSWVVIVQGNFDPARYEWIEKYIHFGVHVFPVASAIYLLTQDAFHANGQICWIASVPAGCGPNTDIECTVGPEDPEAMMFWFAGLPAIFFLLFPTLAMVGLVLVVWWKGRTGNIPSIITASMVAKQSVFYLGSLYWVYLPLIIYYGGVKKMCPRSFGKAVWVTTVSVSLGLWFAIVYQYFSSSGKEPSAFSCEDLGCGGCGEDPEGSKFSKRSTEPIDNAHSISHNDDDVEEGEVVFSADVVEELGVLNDIEDNNNNERSENFLRSGSNHSRSDHFSRRRDGSGKSLRSKSGRGGSKKRWSLNEHSTHGSRERFSFNIFDGTASSGKFAAFVFDGDSDDEEADLAEARHWAGCQKINSDR